MTPRAIDCRSHRGVGALLVCASALLLVAAGCASPAASPGAASKPAAPATGSGTAGSPPPTGLPAAPTAATTAARAPELVQVGHLANPSDVYIYLAIEKGYFKEQGIETELHFFDTGARIIPPMSAGQLDVGRGTISAGLFNAYARGLAIKIVASGSRIIPGINHFSLVVRGDLAGEIATYADLRGRTLAYPGEGSGNVVALDRALQKGDLSIDDVQHVTLAFPDIVSALGNRAIDGGLMVEPLTTLGQQRGVLVRWRDASDFTLGQEVSVLTYSPRLMEERPDAARRFMVAYIQGLREYYEAFFGGKQNQDEVIEVLTRYTSIKDPGIFKQMAAHGVDPNGRVSADSLQADQEWFLARGLVQTLVSMDQVVAPQYVNAALETLGIRN